MTESPVRLSYEACAAELRRPLAESAPSRIQLLTGPTIALVVQRL